MQIKNQAASLVEGALVNDFALHRALVDKTRDRCQGEIRGDSRDAFDHGQPGGNHGGRDHRGCKTLASSEGEPGRENTEEQNGGKGRGRERPKGVPDAPRDLFECLPCAEAILRGAPSAATRLDLYAQQGQSP